jgi:replicative DNA helicase
MAENTRIVPQDLEAEKSVLGSVIIDDNAMFEIAEVLRPEHFYPTKHQLIFEACLDLFEKREPIDLVTLGARLKKKKQLSKVGGSGYLAELASYTPTSANIKSYASIVKSAYTKRELITASAKINEYAFDAEFEEEDIIDKTEQLLYSISKDTVKKDFSHIKDVLAVTFEKMDELHKNKGALRGVPTGFPSLDKKTNGFQESNLIIIAARPSVGKSSLASNIAQFAATQKGSGVIIFSLEMSAEEIADRMISAEAGLDMFKLKTGNMSEDEFTAMGEAFGTLSEAPIFIEDTPGISVLELRTKARRLAMEHDISMIIVDYIQLMRGRNLDNRAQEVAEISQALKNLARELKVPVVALSQLNRQVENRGGGPQLSDLRESGAIEQDADIVMFLHRPDDENRTAIELIISKHRNGPTGKIDLFFKGEQTRFLEVEKNQPAAEQG